MRLLNYAYVTLNQSLTGTSHRRDLLSPLTILINISSMQAAATRNSNKILGTTGKVTNNIILTLHKTLTYPHTQYWVRLWHPHFMKDLVELGKGREKEG